MRPIVASRRSRKSAPFLSLLDSASLATELEICNPNGNKFLRAWYICRCDNAGTARTDISSHQVQFLASHLQRAKSQNGAWTDFLLRTDAQAAPNGHWVYCEISVY